MLEKKRVRNTKQVRFFPDGGKCANRSNVEVFKKMYVISLAKKTATKVILNMES